MLKILESFYEMLYTHDRKTIMRFLEVNLNELVDYYCKKYSTEKIKGVDFTFGVISLFLTDRQNLNDDEWNLFNEIFEGELERDLIVERLQISSEVWTVEKIKNEFKDDEIRQKSLNLASSFCAIDGFITEYEDRKLTSMFFDNISE